MKELQKSLAVKPNCENDKVLECLMTSDSYRVQLKLSGQHCGFLNSWDQ